MNDQYLIKFFSHSFYSKNKKLKTESKWIKTNIVDHYLLFGGRLRIVIKNYLIKQWSFMHGSLHFRLFSRIANTKMHGTWVQCRMLLFQSNCTNRVSRCNCFFRSTMGSDKDLGKSQILTLMVPNDSFISQQNSQMSFVPFLKQQDFFLIS